MEGGAGNAAVELEPAVVAAAGSENDAELEAGTTNGRRRMVRLTQQKIDRLIEMMAQPRPVLPVVFPDGLLAGDPEKREEYLARMTHMVGEMQLVWDDNKKLYDQYCSRGYAEEPEVLVYDMGELCYANDDH